MLYISRQRLKRRQWTLSTIQEVCYRLQNVLQCPFGFICHCIMIINFAFVRFQLLPIMYIIRMDRKSRFFFFIIITILSNTNLLCIFNCFAVIRWFRKSKYFQIIVRSIIRCMTSLFLIIIKDFI